jgi:hypothetical protein
MGESDQIACLAKVIEFGVLDEKNPLFDWYRMMKI